MSLKQLTGISNCIKHIHSLKLTLAFFYVIIRNIFHLLVQREVSPRTKHQARRIWNNSQTCDPDLIELRFADADAKQDIFSW